MLYYLLEYVCGALKDYFILLPILIIMEIFICRYYKKREVTVTGIFCIGYQIFACYVLAVLSVTGAAAVNQLVTRGNEFLLMSDINLIPFVGFKSDRVLGMLLNVIMMTPLGILLPLLWKETGFVKTTATGFLFSLAIEVSQLFNWRATDIDDLILNTLGTMLGFLLYTVFLKRIKWLQKMQVDRNSNRMHNSAMFHVMLLFFMRFFVGRPLLGVVWNMMYS